MAFEKDQLVRSGDQDAEVLSTIESYKHRSKNYFNPLTPQKELFVCIPEQSKLTPNRVPFYLNQLDLIVNGVGEATRGVPRRNVLIGHQNNELKQQILERYTRDNLESLQHKLGALDEEKRKEIVSELKQIKRDQEDEFKLHQFVEQRDRDKVLTLKERLIAQKQERLNQKLFDQIEDKRPTITSIPFDEMARKKPLPDGTFYKSTRLGSLTDAFKRMNNPEIEKLRNASL